MNVRVAENAGFCFGVDRAVKLAEQTLAEEGVCWSLGELTHNRDVVARLAEKGMRTARSADQVPDGATVLIRAMGCPVRR